MRRSRTIGGWVATYSAEPPIVGVVKIGVGGRKARLVEKREKDDEAFATSTEKENPGMKKKWEMQVETPRATGASDVGRSNCREAGDMHRSDGDDRV